MSDPTPAPSIVRMGRRTFLDSNGRGDQVLIGPDIALSTDISAVSEQRLPVLVPRARAAMDNNCTVGRTLKAGATHELRILEGK